MSDSSGSSSASSTSAFVSSLIFNGIIAGIFISLFMAFRPKNTRVYEPRTLPDVQTVTEEERLQSAPQGMAWIPYLIYKPHSYLMQHASLDGYFFLRYVGLVASLSVFTCFLLFPILLPVNATNGNNYPGFDLLSFANVTNHNRFYAHVFLSWLFFGLLIYVIYKELYYYVMVRHAVQTSPLYDSMLSSRTVIVTELSGSSAQPGEMEMRFPKASNILFAHNQSELIDLVKDRSKSSMKLENAINKVIKKSVKMRIKAEKKDTLNELYNGGTKPEDDLETYIPHGKRPTHRLGKYKLPFLGTKVDTLDYSREHISELNEKIHEQQNDWNSRDTLPVCFLEFDTQLEAQRCFQSLESIMGSKSFGKRMIGVAPDDVNWENVNFTKNKRRALKTAANTFLTLLIIFWAIPVAVVGCISNVTFLEDNVFFLNFLRNVPRVILGLITGIVPSLALSILMSLVPVFIKKAGTLSGSISSQETESYCQAWYYAFQVVQVFLITTATSSASSTVVAIINDPSSAMVLLAQNLPKASNFYISYFLVQGLLIPTGALFQVANLILSKVLGRVLDSTPRQKWNRYNTLSKPSWGVIYPVIEILVCIWVCYAIIAPLVLIFSSMALCFMYLAYLYNINFVMGFSFDSRGRNYPRALFQIFVGIYLSEVCLLGLFIMGKAWGPLVLEAIIIPLTVLAHLYFKRRFIPLFDAVPLSALRLARGAKGLEYPHKDQGLKEIAEVSKEAKKAFDDNETGGVLRPATSAELKKAHLINDVDTVSEKPAKSYSENRRSSTDSDGADTKRGSAIVKKTTLTSGSDSVQGKSTFAPDVKNLPREHIGENVLHVGAIEENADAGKVYADPRAIVTTPQSFPSNINKSEHFKQRVINFFSPSMNYPFGTVRTRLPLVYNTVVEYDDEFTETAYTDPSVSEKDPKIWICHDELGLSKQQIQEASAKNIDVIDDFTKFDEKGNCEFLFNPPDYELPAKK
ncbi:hypothetical protein HG535_0H03060 [Zygotorulaspora mrakii]|uniref:Uncharacterized protein n=1 Tax=Zygotorulaspora mrakii TaxID=42260 RepID=A0A7H9BAC9_ZYGMR|nr:uncharacterized protein HG535_0H03060 [Zygotorulaspora mrakii]QLG74979.1 hypothetical protein HG535_0H03060 [Zygotorulaspora mrakii]